MTSDTKSKNRTVSSTDRQMFRDAIANLPVGDSEQQDFTENDTSTISTKAEPVFQQSANTGILNSGGDLFYRPGIQKNTLRNLKRGRISPQAEIDLHGCTRDEALRYIQQFIQRSKDEELVCVRIITGKGRSSPNFHSIIKEESLNWLRNESSVLAYSMATHTDGGNGAYYVLLRI